MSARYLHAFTGVAQLKRYHQPCCSHAGANLHAFTGVAQLKHPMFCVCISRQCPSPRLHRRGPIEASMTF